MKILSKTPAAPLTSFDYSKRSHTNLFTCHRKIIFVFSEVIKYRDCSILEGRREAIRQNELYKLGFSKLIYPRSTHNAWPSIGVDAAPYPIKDFAIVEPFYYFAGFVLALAESKGIKLIWGGDWDKDADFTDQTFNDLIHFELDGNYF